MTADATTTTVQLRAAGYPVQVGLRAQPESLAATVVENALGLPLPLVAHTATGDERRSILWLGPDEWLVVDATDATALPAPGPALAATLAAATEGAGLAAVTDLSANRCAYELHGTAAVDVLATVCALDLHPRAFGPGSCAQTLVAGTPVLLHELACDPAAGRRFRLLVRPSLAAFLEDWLRDAILGVTAAASGTGR